MTKSIRLFIPALVSVLLAPAARVHAGEPEDTVPPLTVGRKVRFVAPAAGPELQVGRILALDDETLTVKVGGRPLQVRRDAITRLDASRRTSRWREGLMVGAAIGFGLFALAAAPDDGFVDIKPGEVAPIGAAIGALAGAGVGAFIETDHWHPVSPQRLRVSVGPVPGRGVGASVSLRF
jgi:hypothetical protein